MKGLEAKGPFLFRALSDANKLFLLWGVKDYLNNYSFV